MRHLIFSSACLLLVVVAYAAGDPPAEPLRPDPGLAAGDVVRIQVEALGRNGTLDDDEGIRIAFRFASPDNRASTGPLHRFIDLLKDRSYRDMLDHRSAEYHELVLDEERAAQRVTLVTLDYREVDFVFFLSRRDLPDCEGCWMTDAVHREGGGPPPGAGRRIGV